MSITTATARPADPVRSGEVFRPSTPACFVAGTRIATPAGERPVEDLAEGDLVAVIGPAGQSYRPVCWIGKLRIDLTSDSASDLLAPVRIGSDAIAHRQPARDARVAPDHGILIDGALVAARKLVNGMTIVRETSIRVVDYYQVELEKHGVLLADGLPVESYLGSRHRVMPVRPPATAAHPLQVWEQVACAPRVVDPFHSRHLWERCAARARSRGLAPPPAKTATDPDLHLLADGRRIAPIQSTSDQYSFVLPKGTRHLVLASRAGRLTDTVHYADDRRTLGVAVVSIVLRGRGDMIVLPADALPAGTGWHPPEIGPRTVRRWTDGAGELRFDALPDARIMDVKLGGSMTYIVPGSPRE